MSWNHFETPTEAIDSPLEKNAHSKPILHPTSEQTSTSLLLPKGSHLGTTFHSLASPDTGPTKKSAQLTAQPSPGPGHSSRAPALGVGQHRLPQPLPWAETGRSSSAGQQGQLGSVLPANLARSIEPHKFCLTHHHFGAHFLCDGKK